MSWFIVTADRYVLTGMGMGEMCERNAEVARSLSRNQVAQAWLTLKTLYELDLESSFSEFLENKLASRLLLLKRTPPFRR